MSVLIRSFTKAISLWFLKIFIQNWYCKSQIVQGIFYTSKFLEKMKLKDVASKKHEKRTFLNQSDLAVCIPTQSQDHQIYQKTPQCASHRRVKLCGVLRVYHTAESKCKPRSQNRNLYKSLGAFDGTIRRNPCRGNNSIM